MRELEPGWDHVIRVTWLLLWRGLFGGILIGLALGLAINMATAFAFGLVPSRAINVALGVIAALIWWPVAVRMALKKQYSGFRLALVSPEGG